MQQTPRDFYKPYQTPMLKYADYVRKKKTDFLYTCADIKFKGCLIDVIKNPYFKIIQFGSGLVIFSVCNYLY
jgi:hypothetical protein